MPKIPQNRDAARPRMKVQRGPMKPTPPRPPCGTCKGRRVIRKYAGDGVVYVVRCPSCNDRDPQGAIVWEAA